MHWAIMLFGERWRAALCVLSCPLTCMYVGVVAAAHFGSLVVTSPIQRFVPWSRRTGRATVAAQARRHACRIGHADWRLRGTVDDCNIYPKPYIRYFNPLPTPPPGIVVGAVHGRRGTRAAARGAPGAAW